MNSHFHNLIQYCLDNGANLNIPACGCIPWAPPPTLGDVQVVPPVAEPCYYHGTSSDPAAMCSPCVNNYEAYLEDDRTREALTYADFLTQADDEYFAWLEHINTPSPLEY